MNSGAYDNRFLIKTFNTITIINYLNNIEYIIEKYDIHVFNI